MLRTALKILLALALIAQGGVSAFAHDGVGSAAKMHCQHADEHGKPTRMPCCPDGCVTDAAGLCSACAFVFIAPPLTPPLPFEFATTESNAVGAPLASTTAIPPTRPPIA